MANVKSVEGFIILSVANALFNIGTETSQSCVSLLIPEDKSTKYFQMVYIVHGLDFVLAAVILSILIEFISFQQLFYGAAPILWIIIHL